MAGKRSRATYEADLRKEQSPFATFGTPLPPRDPDVRDDGSFVPVWKQEVRDDRGLKRLHGAFTGGFSAGYYNTVGSKEGWTPSTFVSSRSTKKKDEAKPVQQRPEDFMDEEDLADAAEAQRVETAAGFSGIGSTHDDAVRRGGLVDLFRTAGETMGVKLLKKMGWKEGQGVGPKVRRKAQLHGAGNSDQGDETHLFAPENTHMISFIRKNDHKGIGFDGEKRLDSNGIGSGKDKSDDEDNDRTSLVPAKAKKKPVRGGIGIGILNDTGSDDEDPYEIGPRISYNRVIGGDKKKKKPVKITTNPDLKTKPVFISKKASLAKAAYDSRKCHDGHLPLSGFRLSSKDEFSSVMMSSGKYKPPKVPENWTSSKVKSVPTQTAYISTADAAKASKLDPKARASILGEAALKGKSVFDYMSKEARDRLAATSGNQNLPQGLGEIPKGYSLTEEQRQAELLSQVPKVDKATADAALSRGASMPYADDPEKLSRYRAYLENQAGLAVNIPAPEPRMGRAEWLNEMREFASCAQIFKPMSGPMASRFARASTGPQAASDPSQQTLSKPVPKPEDPAEQAARMGMFGPMTRSSAEWFPTRLLCKRFNIQPPKNVQPGVTEHGEEEAVGVKEKTKTVMRSEDYLWEDKVKSEPVPEVQVVKEEVVIDAERNDALEGQRAGEAAFKAVFGDSSDEDDE